MDLSERGKWQQAAGDGDRNYIKVCLDWDVVLFGPGYAGKWPDCKKRLLRDGQTSRKMTTMRYFCEDVKAGDVVVLRSGTSDVFGVGVVVGEYEWLDEFGDVDGWNLQHVRRVKWLWKDYAHPKRFSTYSLKQGDTTQKLTSQLVVEWIESLGLDFDNCEEPIALPEKLEREINFDDIAEFLFDQGVASGAIAALSDEIGELIRIARWYKKNKNPSEAETVAYLAIPLLRALGWTPQKMAIEWKKLDIALFHQLPRNDQNLLAVVEAKKKGNSCLTAFSQAAKYARDKKNCKRLIVTDGLRYGVYIKKEENFNLYAYFNLTRLRDEYPIYHCKGAKHALRAMTPEWSEEIEEIE